MAFEASAGVKDAGDQLICPPALDFESYTDIVERVTSILSKRPRTGTVVLRLTPRGVATGPPPAPRTPEALLNWEKALGLLQQTSQLLVAFVDDVEHPAADVARFLARVHDLDVARVHVLVLGAVVPRPRVVLDVVAVLVRLLVIPGRGGGGKFQGARAPEPP